MKQTNKPPVKKTPLAKSEVADSKNPPVRQLKPKPPPPSELPKVEVPLSVTPDAKLDSNTTSLVIEPNEISEYNSVEDIPMLEISKPPVDQYVIDSISSRIHKHIKDIRMRELQLAPAEEIEPLLATLADYMNEYHANADCNFELHVDSIICDLVEEWYYLLNSRREADALRELYAERALLTVPGAKEPIVGSARCAAVWVDAYKDLRVQYSADRVEIDSSGQPDKLSPAYDAFVTVHSRLAIEGDGARRIMEVLQWGEARQQDQDPLHRVSSAHEALRRACRGRTYRIQKHILVCLDPRPLYCFPYLPIPKTRYNNWEPHLRPDDYESVGDSTASASPHSKSPHDLLGAGRFSHSPSVKSLLGDESAGEEGEEGSALDPLEDAHSEAGGPS